MSIIFRLKYNLGLISTADQLDTKWEKLIKMRDDLLQMEGSDFLKQYVELKELTDSESFKHHKHEIENLRYAGSKEQRLISEYRDLARSGSIKNYLKVSVSENLKRFNRIQGGSELKRYLELHKEIESPEFKKRKASLNEKHYRESPDYNVHKEYVQSGKSNDIRFWNKFRHSTSFLNYGKTSGSRELLRYEELKEMTAEPTFLRQVAYLKDGKRFLKSEEYKSIQQFKELDKSRFMSEYRKLKKNKALDFFDTWEIVLDENFTERDLDTKKWQPENWLGYRLSGASFSQEGEKQSFHGLKNIQIKNNTLTLLARKEKVAGKVWNSSVGLIPKEHDYTSSILNTADFFRMREGVVEAKVRFKKDATIVSSFSLTGEKPFPQIDLFRSNKRGVGMGIVEKFGDKSEKYLNLSGLNDGHFHIYRLEIFGDQLVWKINGYEVFRNTLRVKEPLFFNLLTSLHGKVNEQQLPHQFEVDWIRGFALKG